MSSINFKIGDLVQVFDFEKNKWSKNYKIFKINSPDDENVIGYCDKTSYWMKSLNGKWERTWYNTEYMRKVF